ncbi:MAG: hypothetical protein K2I93_01970, partial [Oscillospiraceae bacterium]|nr:hypothetical protein [Oscillospiraceae bacterium]
MKKSTMQRTMASAMTAALLVTVLTGCGSSGGGSTSFEKNGKGSTLEVSLDHSYSSEQLKFDDMPNIGGITPINDKFLVVSYDENYENEIFRLYNPEDGSVTEADLSYPGTLPENGDSYMTGGFTNSQGGFTCLHRAYVSGEDENGDYQYEDLGLIIANYDDTLKLIDSKKLDTTEELNFNNIIMKPEGGYYANGWDENGNSVFYILDDEFKEVGKVDGSFQYINNIFTAKDNSIYVTYQDMEWNEKFAKLNTESNKLEEIAVEGLPQWYNNTFLSATDDYTLYISDSTAVYGVNLTNGTCEEVINWVNSDFMGDYVNSVNQLPDGRFILISNDMDYKKSEIWVLSPRDPEELKNIKLISLATLYLPSSLSSAINQFNRSNDEYRIAVVDYEKYNTDDNYEAGLEKLKSDMTAGVVADLICTSNIPYESFCNKGVFTDLTDKVNGLSSDEYFTNVFDTFKYGDKLYQMGFAFQINTLEAKTEHVGENGGISLADFTKLVTELPNGMTSFSEMTKSSALYSLVTNNLVAFTDVKNGTCNFNTPEFV